MTDSTPSVGDLRVWYIPQVPMPPYEVRMPSQDLAHAAFVLDAIIGLSIFEFENRVKPDYSDMAGIDRWDGDDWETIEEEEYADD